MGSQSLDRFVVERRVFFDPKTGREVWQLTDGPFECVTPYMDREAWTPDERYIVFMCNRTGAWQPYRMDVETGEARQLAEIESGEHSFYAIAMDAPRGECYVGSGSRFVAIHVETLEARVAADFSSIDLPHPDDKRWGRQPVLNRAGTLVLAVCRAADGRPQLVVMPTDGRTEYQIFPLSGIFRRPCHEQFCPADDNLISFCNLPDHQDDPRGHPDLRVREWRLDRDTAATRPLVLTPPGFRATHCIWGASGERFYFHRKTCPWWMWVPTALCSVNRDGGDLRVYYETSEHKLGHSCPTADERWIVTDSQDPDENILALVSAETGSFQILCWPNMSQNSKRPDKRPPNLPPHTHRHTHPAFSPSGRFVHYVSDVTGCSHVYVVPVGDLIG